MTLLRLCGAASLGLMLQGCIIEAEPIRPLRGPQPQRIAVAPVLAEPGSLVERWLPGAMGRALQQRGYPVLDADAGIQEMVGAGLARVAAGLAPPAEAVQPGESELADVGDLLNVDALARADVILWQPRMDGDEFIGLTYNIRWTIVSIASGYPIWWHETKGAWRRSDRIGADAGAASPWEGDRMAGTNNGTGLPGSVAGPNIPFVGVQPSSELEFIRGIAEAAYRGLR